MRHKTKAKFACLTMLTIAVLAGGRALAISNENSPTSVQVPIVMYHSIYDQVSNEWTLSHNELEADLKFLKDSGYETVFISELAAFVKGEAILPEKPIVLSFDDAYYNNYTAVLPLLEKYDMKMVLSVIGKNSEIWSNSEETSELYGHVTWAQLKEMSESGKVELANHTWDMHSLEARYGCSQNDGEDLPSYSNALVADIEKLQSKLEDVDGKSPICFTYPYGKKSDSTEPIIREMGFQATLSVQEGINIITQGDADSLYNLKRYNRSSSRPISQIIAVATK